MVSEEHKFDSKKFGENLRDSIHEQIHRNINDRVNWKRGGPRHRPLVVGIDLRGRGRGGMFIGAIVALVGLAFLLDNLGIIAIGKLWQFWPMARGLELHVPASRLGDFLNTCGRRPTAQGIGQNPSWLGTVLALAAYCFGAFHLLGIPGVEK